MKIYNIENTEDFFKVVDSCKDDVELLSSEGDRLNLKSKLCKYIALKEIFAAVGDEFPKLELVCHDPNDAMKFINYMTDK